MELVKPGFGVLRNVGSKITRIGGPKMAQLAFTAKKNAPVILLVTGGVMIVGGAILACKNTIGLEDELSAHMDAINLNKDAVADPGNEEDIPEIKACIRKEWVETGLDLGKRYIVPAGMLVTGITLTVAARNIEHSRFLMAMASVESINVAFEAYRKRVIEDQGLAADKRYMDGTYDAEADFYGDQPEDKRKKAKKETVTVVGGKIPGSPYSVIFSEETSDCWSNDRADNKYFIDTTCVYLNQRLRERGYLFLNEAYEALGLEYEPIAQITGWILPGDDDDAMFRDGEVHILVTELYLEEEIVRSRTQHTNPSPTLRLDFNVDGVIWEDVKLGM